MSIVVKGGIVASIRGAILLMAFLSCLTSFGRSAPVTLDGNRLLPQCEEAVRIANDSTRGLDADASYCLGFLTGIMTMTDEVRMANSKYAKLPCYPDGMMTAGQAARVVTKYLNSHPETLHRDAHILVIEALREAFPCN
jgi:hypothetical protein